MCVGLNEKAQRIHIYSSSCTSPVYLPGRKVLEPSMALLKITYKNLKDLTLFKLL